MGTPISGLAALTEGAKGDLIEIIDISDTSMSPNGTNKKIQTKNLTFSEKLESSSIASTGWYTIAELDDSETCGRGVFTAQFNSGHSITCKINMRNKPEAKTHKNVTIELVDTAANTGFVVSEIESFRLAKSDSVEAGAKVQVYLDPGATRNLYVTLSGGAYCDAQGFVLVSAVLENTPTLPDGITSSTFLEAGEEISIITGTVDIIKAKKGSSDQLFCTIEWPGIPKQGTGLTITLPSIALTFTDGAGTSATISGSHSITNFNITGSLVRFRIDETGVFTSLNAGPLRALWNGTGGKITIT